MANVKISDLPAATTVNPSDVFPIDQGATTRKVRVDQLPSSGGGSPSDATPQPLGTAAAGTSALFSRGDHIHAMPSAADVGAAPTSHTHDAAAVVTGVLDNARVNFASPAPIGSSVPNAGSFTTLSATGTATLPHIHGSIAGNLYIHVRNGSGSAMARGTAVYVIGNVGDTDRVIVAPADNTDPAKLPAVGLLDQDLANNEDGDAIILGELDAANTSAYTLNQELFVGASGSLTNVRPSSGRVQSVGLVARVQQNSGVIVVNMQASNIPIASPSNATPQALGTASAGTATAYAREDHIHAMPTAADIGLGNVNNTSDADKPVSTATQLALDAKVDDTQVGAANGVASLDSSGKLASSQVPSIAITQYLGNVADEAAMLALTGEQGDWCIRSDSGTTFVITGNNPAQIGSWTQLAYPAAPVTSVNGETGVVVIDKTDVGLGNVTNDAQVTSVTGTAPIVSSGGTTPAISINDATTSASGAMSAADKIKLDGIASGAEVNVNADWNATSGDAQILNKPEVPAPNINPPAALGPVASAGAANLYSRGDHIHPLPTAQQVGALEQAPLFVSFSFTQGGENYVIPADRQKFLSVATSVANTQVTLTLPNAAQGALAGDRLTISGSIGSNVTLTITGAGQDIVYANTAAVGGVSSFVLHFIRQAGFWTRIRVENHDHPLATTNSNGFMSSIDKNTLDSFFPTVKNPTIYVRRFANFENSGFNGNTSSLNTLSNLELNQRGYYLLTDDYFEWDPIRWAFPNGNFFFFVYIECGGIFNDGLHIHFRRRNISNGNHLGFAGTMENGHLQAGNSNGIVALGGSGTAAAWNGSPARERVEVWLSAYNNGNGGFINNFVYKVING